MKIRNGFVSNSSSSSFIIKLGSIPNSPDELKKLLYSEDAPEFIIDLDDESYSTDRLCEIVYNDVIEAIEENENISEHMSIHEYNCGEFKHLIKDDNLLKEYNILERKLVKLSNESNIYKEKDDDIKFQKINDYFSKYNSICDEMRSIIMESLNNSKKENEIFIKLEYSDNDGSTQSFLEHGDFLDPITLVKISNH